MSQTFDTDLIDHKYCRSNESITLDLKRCQRHLDLLRKYRELLSEVCLKCICDQKNDIQKGFSFLETQYHLICNNDNESEEDDQNNQINYETIDVNFKEQELELQQEVEIVNNSLENILSADSRPNLGEDNPPVNKSGTNGHTVALLIPLKTYSSNKPLYLIPKAALNTQPFNKQQIIQEFTSQSIPVFNQIPKPVIQRPTNDRKDKDLKKIQEFNDYLRYLSDLKVGKLEQFIDPTNKLISVYRKKNDDKNEWTVVFKCLYNYCEFETSQKRYIKKHVERHERETPKRSAMKYRIFCRMLNDLKSGKIDSFIDPEYQMVSVSFKESQTPDEETEQTVKEIIYKCNHLGCQYETNNKSYIRTHVVRHMKNKAFECNLCAERFKSNLLLIVHRVEVHKLDKDRLFKCNLAGCGFKTIVKQSFKLHSISHQTEKPFKCSFNGCDSYYKTELAVKEHYKTVHTTPVFYECEWPGCVKKFKNQKYMSNHLLTHTEDKITVGKMRSLLKNGNYVSTVDTKNDMFSVIREQIINETDGKISVGAKLGYKCNYTDCKFLSRVGALGLMLQHITGHSMGKTFKCDLCDKSYVLQKNLGQHKRLFHNINNKNPEIRCQYCDYKTRNIFCMKQHEVIHRTDTPFKCKKNGCEKRFKTKFLLETHLKYTHNKVRPYVCEYPGCKSAFKKKSDLTKHMKIHDKEPLSCNRCAKTFKLKSLLVKHQKTKH